jgi:hypothetical protein
MGVQVYMLLLGVTAMSLLTTPFVIMTSIHLLAKDYQNPVYISGACHCCGALEKGLMAANASCVSTSATTRL